MSTEQATLKRTPAKRKARQLAKHLRAERPDYAYLKEVFRHLRDELDVEVAREPKRLPYVPTEAEVRRYYETVWKERRGGDIVLIKTLLYTGVRVAELVAIRLDDVDLDTCRIRINLGKGAKDRVVPLPTHLPRDAQPAHRLPAIQRSSLPIRVELEEALLHPGSPSPARPLRPQGRPGAQHAPPPPPPLPVHLAQDPRPRRRSDPALQRPHQPQIPRDLQPPVPRRRPRQLRPGHQALPGLIEAVGLPLGTRLGVGGLVDDVAVADQHAGISGVDDLGGLSEPAPVSNPAQGELAVGGHPQPLALTADPPVG